MTENLYTGCLVAMTELYKEIIQCDKINRKYRMKFFSFDSFSSIKTNLKNFQTKLKLYSNIYY